MLSSVGPSFGKDPCFCGFGFWIESVYVLLECLLLCFDFRAVICVFLGLHSFLLDSQSILPILGSQQFLAFLASAIAFLQLVLHDICGVYLLIFSLTYLFFIKDHSTLRAGFCESTLDDLVRILLFACSLEATIGDDFIKVVF